MAKPELVYIVEYTISGRGDVETTSAAIALTWEQFTQWLTVWGGPKRGDEILQLQQKCFDYIEEYCESNGAGFYMIEDLVDKAPADIVFHTVKDGRKTYVFEAEEGLIGIGKNFERVVAAMRRKDLDICLDTGSPFCFDTEQFNKPEWPHDA